MEINFIFEQISSLAHRMIIKIEIHQTELLNTNKIFQKGNF